MQQSLASMEGGSDRAAIAFFDALTSRLTASADTEDQEFQAKLPLESTMFDSRTPSPFQSSSQDEVDSRDSPVMGPLRPKLTLSAFRRPEQTIRLTHSDPTRRLSSEYNLHATGCGVLGHGAFSTVRLAVRRSDSRKVAVKTIAKHEALRSRRLRISGRHYMEEWEILKRFENHPYIISLLDVFETDEEIQLVMEYCEGGELFDAIRRKRSLSQRRGRFTENEAARITSQILRALVDIHAFGIVHRDVKAENILLTCSDEDGALHVKLCDFGVARTLSKEPETPSSSSDGESSPITPCRTRSFSIVGSNYYEPPEVSFGESYSTAVDVYSLGVTLYILLCGFPPVFAGNEGHSEVLFPNCYWKDISDEAKSLVKQMLNPAPGSRISAREALSDPWIVKNIYSRPAIDHKQVNMELVRNCLYKRCGEDPSKAVIVRSNKRARRASNCLMALADLYRGVASAPSTMAAPAIEKADSSLLEVKPGSSIAALSC